MTKEEYKATYTKYNQSAKGKAYIKAYNQSEKGKAYQKAYNQSEHGKAVRKKWRQSKAGKVAEKKYRQSKKWKIVRKEYNQSEAGKISEARCGSRRRSHNKNVINDLTLEQWEQILRDQNNKCIACDRPFTKELPPEKEHMLPLTRGGGLTLGNVQAMCKNCNSSKSNKTMSEWKRGSNMDVQNSI